MKAFPAAVLLFALAGLRVNAQTNDTITKENFSFHAQTTVTYQYKPGYSAPYSGQNSFRTDEEQSNSVTATFFAGARLWKGASVFVNPEMAGGSGLSKVLGVADATNGETFRVGSTSPKIYLARAFIKQIFSLSDATQQEESDQNQLAGTVPQKYLSVIAGKICLSDYFDQNSYSHDPRTQFMNWGLMSNGAWDYPANTRGYIPSIVLEYVTPKDELRFAVSLLPAVANGLSLNWNASKANSATLEYTRNYSFMGKKGAVRLLGFLTSGKMGNYRDAIALNPTAPVIEDVQHYGNKKYGFGLNAEQEINDFLGCFFRASWNDGKTQTWAFTEIDKSISLGLSANGNKWNRADDTAGLAIVASGISNPHRDYLAAGGYGFMLGDGKLNYRTESVTEFYYTAKLSKNDLYFTGGYQFLLNPGYNRDRNGLINVFSLRLHANL